tara:strand:+ start:157 stop:390 length:234 start_codon:yes stop_codon:yes gene_type:complete
MGWRDIQVDGKHYSTLKIQPTDFIIKNKLGWCEGNIVKYVTRHNEKGKSKDIRKVIHYALMILEDEYDEQYEIKSVD